MHTHCEFGVFYWFIPKHADIAYLEIIGNLFMEINFENGNCIIQEIDNNLEAKWIWIDIT